MEKHRENNGVVLEQDGKIHDPNDMAGRRSTGRCVGEGRCRMVCTVWCPEQMLTEYEC